MQVAEEENKNDEEKSPEVCQTIAVEEVVTVENAVRDNQEEMVVSNSVEIGEEENKDEPNVDAENLKETTPIEEGSNILK
jgi:hypothetical protein